MVLLSVIENIDEKKNCGTLVISKYYGMGPNIIKSAIRFLFVAILGKNKFQKVYYILYLV